ncbi:MAG: type II secretion system protein [Rhodocyclales bacterium]|nr:type II secretion system protein [Rhodocyclales bacterium]
MKNRGFTLLELVMVIVITGVIASSLTIFLVPAVNSYFDSRRRADLTDLADTALRRMSQDIRRAVPNSIRSFSGTCFSLSPTTSGGRYRVATDTVNGVGQAVDTSTTTSSFDVLSPMGTVPAANDWVVVDNENSADVYAGTNRGQVSGVATPAATAGLTRITLTGATQFPAGYDGGRFVVVSNGEQAVFYSCNGGTLYRTVAAFGANQATTCGLTNGAIVATDIAGCTFVYDPNQGATQQSGFVWMRLQLSRSGETITLTHGAHVDNAP